MLNYYYLVAFSYTIAIASVIGLVRYKKILASYRLFVVFVTMAFVNEIISSVLVELIHNNAVNGNIYVLAEATILFLLFYQWGSFGNKMLGFLLTMIGAVWCAENLVFSSITHFNSFFRLFYSLAIVILSIDQINITMLHERKNLFRNAKFIICCLFTFYYTFKATYEVFYFVPRQMSDTFYNNLFLILVFVNLFANLGYAIAALWIPTKQKFTLPY
ncbi:MAG: hypothetical protein V4450_10465 [Bacteroidota bacterium]